jgi:hypothetical protein
MPKYRADGDYEPGDTVFAANGLSYQCLLSNFHDSAHEPSTSPTYWVRWGHTDADVVTLVHANPSSITVSTLSNGISVTSGSVGSVMDVYTGYGTVVRDLSFTISNAANGYVDITFSSPISFLHGGIQNAQFTPAVNTGFGAAEPSYVEITGANTVRIHCVRSNGPNWGGYVRLMGF